MKVVGAPLAVCAGENEPQVGALAHSANQSTPAFAGSPLTVAETWAVPTTFKEAGGAWVRTSEMSGVSDVLLTFAAQPASVRKAGRASTNAKKPDRPKHDANRSFIREPASSFFIWAESSRLTSLRCGRIGSPHRAATKALPP